MAIRHPPQLQPMLRLQRTVGNRAAQRILGIGNGQAESKPIAPAPREPPAPRLTARRHWLRAGLLALAAALLAAGGGIWAGTPVDRAVLAGGGVALATIALVVLSHLRAQHKSGIQ